LQIIGIHTPEFDWEKDRSRMRREMQKYDVSYPQVLDDDFKYWKALNNRYWPSFYVIDKQGKIKGSFAGETHEGDSQAAKIEAMISELGKE
jgi:hypothetical protein